MELSGGVVSVATAVRRPVCTVESGGAAGVLSAGLLGAQLGEPDVISFDMGGTTAKTGIVRDGHPHVTHSFQVGGKGSFGTPRAGTGIPVKTPVVDLAEVGAGGGSRAWLDAGGALRVGPGSVGAVPGPACYGRGGTEPTVTDADLLLGYLDPAGLAGGIALSAERAERAVASVADPLGLDVADTASAIHEIANATMAAAIRLVTVQRGIDPRDFTLVAFGGAGPVHAAALAATFGIRSVVVPWGAGVASAVGLVGSEPTAELVQTHLVALADAAIGDLETRFTDLEGRAHVELGVDADTPVTVRWAADLRCRGQAHELHRRCRPRAAQRGAGRGAHRPVPRRLRADLRHPVLGAGRAGQRPGPARRAVRRARRPPGHDHRDRRRASGRRAGRAVLRPRRVRDHARLRLGDAAARRRADRPRARRRPRHDGRRPPRRAGPARRAAPPPAPAALAHRPGRGRAVTECPLRPGDGVGSVARR